MLSIVWKRWYYQRKVFHFSNEANRWQVLVQIQKSYFRAVRVSCTLDHGALTHSLPAGGEIKTNETSANQKRASSSPHLRLLEDVLPYLAVIKGVAPAHLDGAHDDILLEDVGAEPPVHLLALLERDLEDSQHEGQNGAWRKEREREC